MSCYYVCTVSTVKLYSNRTGTVLYQSKYYIVKVKPVAVVNKLNLCGTSCRLQEFFCVHTHNKTWIQNRCVYCCFIRLCDISPCEYGTYRSNSVKAVKKKKKKKATRPTLFENFLLLQYNNFFFCLSLYLCCLGVLERVTLRVKHLSVLKVICQLSCHLVSVSRSCCKVCASESVLMVWYMTQSSANSLTVDEMP